MSADAPWWRIAMRYARPYRRQLIAVAALYVVLAVVVALAPWPTKLAVDDVLGGAGAAGQTSGLSAVGGPTAQLVLLALATVALVLVRRGIIGTQRVLRRSLGARMSYDFAHEVLELVQRHTISGDRLRTGDLVQRVVVDTRCAETLVFGVWMTVFQALVTLALMAAIMLSLSGTLTLVALAAVPPMLLVMKAFGAPMRRVAVAEADAQGAIMAGSEQMLASVPEIQSFAAEDAELTDFADRLDRQVRAIGRAQRTYLGYEVGISTVTAAGVSLVMIVIGMGQAASSPTVGDLVVFMSYLAALYSPVESLAQLATSIATSRARALRVVEVLGSGVGVVEAVRPVGFPVVSGGSRVVVEGVSFGYVAGRPVLRGVDLVAEPGEMVALVGHTGAGKSTLLSLVPRFFDPWDGRVLIDGVDVRDAAVRSVRERVSVVRQEPLLLPVSVADNIAYGRPGASRAEVEWAAGEALAAEFVQRLPDGYESVVGERGSTLSGGERQRLAIARALLKDAPVLVLDEPTAALDAESEALVVAALQRVCAQRTVLVIAHRLSTVRRADRIVVLEQGRVVQQGTHDELVESDGPYARYHQLQLSAGAHVPAPAEG